MCSFADPCGATDCRRCYGSRADDESAYHAWCEALVDAVERVRPHGVTEKSVRAAIDTLRGVLKCDPQDLADALGDDLVAEITQAAADLYDESGAYCDVSQVTEDDIGKRIEEARGERAISRWEDRHHD